MKLVVVAALLFAANLISFREALLFLPLTGAFLAVALVRVLFQMRRQEKRRLRLVVDNAKKAAHISDTPTETSFPNTPEGRRKAQRTFGTSSKDRAPDGSRFQ